MPGRRQEESWQRRPRETFLNTESVDDDHEEYNEVARHMWRHNMERKRKAQSLRHPRLVALVNILKIIQNAAAETYSIHAKSC